MPELWDQLRSAPSPQLLVQQPLWRLSASARGSAASSRSIPTCWSPMRTLSVAEGALPVFRQGRGGLARIDPAVAREALRIRPRCAVEEAAQEGARPPPVRDEGERDRDRPCERARGVQVAELVRGGDRQPDPPLPRDPVAGDPRVDRGVHDPARLPRLQGGATEAGEPRRAGRQDEHRRADASLRAARARCDRGTRARRSRTGDRGADHQGDPRSIALPVATWG